jgi:hypothetical protein
MKQNLIDLRASLKKLQAAIYRDGVISPSVKKDLKALDELAESIQDSAEGDDWLSLFDFRNEIAEWMDSELALFV